MKDSEKKTMRMQATAERIVAALFVTGAGQQATRIVLVDKENRDLGGWGRGPAIDCVFDVLRAIKAEKGGDA